MGKNKRKAGSAAAKVGNKKCKQNDKLNVQNDTFDEFVKRNKKFTYLTRDGWLYLLQLTDAVSIQSNDVIGIIADYLLQSFTFNDTPLLQEKENKKYDLKNNQRELTSSVPLSIGGNIFTMEFQQAIDRDMSRQYTIGLRSRLNPAADRGYAWRGGLFGRLPFQVTVYCDTKNHVLRILQNNGIVNIDWGNKSINDSSLDRWFPIVAIKKKQYAGYLSGKTGVRFIPTPEQDRQRLLASN